MFELTHDELKQMQKTCYKTKMPLFVWGATGIGKSRLTKDMAAEMGIDFIDVRLSQLDPSDLRGLPSLAGETTKWLPPDWMPREGKGILFLDELNLAPPSLQASAYELILDRKIGGYTLPEGWNVFSAGNRIEDRAHVFEMPAPLCNRFLHVELKKPFIDPEAVDTGWTGWAMKNDVDMRVVNYLIKNTTDLFKFKGNLKEKAFPTPRSWEMTSRLIRDVPSTRLPYIQMLVSSAIGEGTAVKFNAFLKLGRKIDLQAIFKNPKQVKKIEEVDLKYALVNEMTNFYQNKKDNKAFVGHAAGVIRYLDAEFSIRLLQLCIGIGQSHFIKALVNDKASDDVVIKYGKYLYRDSK